MRRADFSSWKIQPPPSNSPYGLGHRTYAEKDFECSGIMNLLGPIVHLFRSVAVPAGWRVTLGLVRGPVNQ